MHVFIDNPLGPLWSISVEEQFYLILPWLFLIPKWNARGLRAFAALTIIVSIIALWIQGHYLDREIWTNSFSQAIFFGTGMMLASFDESRMKNSEHYTAISLSRR